MPSPEDMRTLVKSHSCKMDQLIMLEEESECHPHYNFVISFLTESYYSAFLKLRVSRWNQFSGPRVPVPSSLIRAEVWADTLVNFLRNVVVLNKGYYGNLDIRWQPSTSGASLIRHNAGRVQIRARYSRHRGTNQLRRKKKIL